MSRKFNLFFASTLVVMATTQIVPLGNVCAQESTYGPVKSGDQIWNIAGKVAPNASVNRQQVIMGILHANPHAFKVPCNFNSLKVGEKLTVPALADIQALSQEEAKKEFDRQNNAWKNRKKEPIVCPAPEATAPAETATTTATATSPTTPPAPKEAPPTPAVVPVPSASSTGVQTLSPATPPPPAPATPQPAEATSTPATAPPPPAPSAPVEAPKPVADTTAPPPPTAATSSTTPAVPPTSPPEASVAPLEIAPLESVSDSHPKAPSQLPDLIIWILIGGGLLSAFIIAGLLHVHAKHEEFVPVEPNQYDFARREPEDEAPEDNTPSEDDMPLHTDQDDEDGDDRSGDVIKE